MIFNMPKIQIDIPKDAYQKLKAQAKDDDRSLTKYITRGMTYLANIPNGYHNQQINSNIIDLSALPEGTTIKTTTPHSLTPEEERNQRFKKFQALAKQIVGHELTDIEDYRLIDYDSDSIYYDKSVEEPIKEGSVVQCVYIYNLPEQKQREYLEEFKHYER